MQQFDRAKQTFSWAEKKFSELHDAEQAFVESQPYEVWRRDTNLPGIAVYREFRASKIKQPGTGMQEIAYRLIGDLRNAMDHALTAACEVINEERLPGTNFPFGDTQAYVESQLASRKGPLRGIPEQLHAKLLSFEPFAVKKNGSKGNMILFALNKGANENKHELALRTEFTELGLQIGNVVGGLLEWNGRWIADDEIELLRFTPTARHAHIEIGLEPTITLVGPEALHGQPAIDAFRQMTSAVRKVVHELEQETINIIS